MREVIFKLVGFGAVLFFIFGIFWGIKRQNWVTIQQMDQAMEPDYPSGTYHVSPRPATQEGLVIGKAHAYVVPSSPEREKRVAWLVAKEGQRVEVKDKSLFVDGVKSDCKSYIGLERFSLFVVPRGTVYMLSITPEKDSFSFGPIPFRNVLGQL